MLIRLVILVVIFIPGLASAQSVPRYDPAAYCIEVSEVSGGSQMIYNGCLQMEQEAYNTLKMSWGSVPDRARSYCDEVARVSGSSYSILKGCLDMETEASNTTPEFKF